MIRRLSGLVSRCGFLPHRDPDTHDSSNTSNSTNASNASNTQESDEVPVRERETKLLYLEEHLKKELELGFGDLNQRYRRERDEELQENKDWWPVLPQIGYEAIGDPRDLDLYEFERAREGKYKAREDQESS
ncbi:hypothetical protein C481_03237 [Natrialba asiatica DSM 12278]|uniref:DUF8160 domain-containing protein n=1 Tax=Natrialba asiatica (strain ATCC 700177 / DSM 12278 / JCM 9576 / FERM P-10747 / NBRC 102637 / 172P1) TaxID=29540 RepID=M0B5K4_NATA1|nr:hypothetical protein C481_03237 [Natrialba asiatica DSM 12278]